jgi:predicted nucleotidyltransferase
MVERPTLLDHSFIYTDDKIFFSICGNIHSKKAVFGMPYYFLTKDLEQIMDIQINEYNLIGGKKYTKLLSQIPRESYPDFIKENFREYYYSPPMWEILMKVDRTKIRKVIDPRSKVCQLLANTNVEESEKNPLLYTLRQIQKINPSLIANVGLAGLSLLKDNPLLVENDIDLVFYKKSGVISAKEFSTIVCSSNLRFTKLEGEMLTKYLNQKSQQFGISQESLYHLVNGRWDILYIDGVKLDFSFVDETRILPIKSYEGIKSSQLIKTKAKITGVSDSYFMPTILDIEHNKFNKIIITKRGYICLFDVGQIVDIEAMEYIDKETGTNFLLIDDINTGKVIPQQ